MQKIKLIQLSLFAFLLSSLFAIFSSSLLFASLSIILAALLAYFISGMEGEEKRTSIILSLFFLLLLLSFFLLHSQLSLQNFIFLPFLAVLFILLLFAVKRLILSTSIEGTVIGYSNGFAVVRIEKGFSHPFNGVYAVPSRKVWEGKKVEVKVSKPLFSPPVLREIV